MTPTLHWTADYIELLVEQHIETTHIQAHIKENTHSLRKGTTQNVTGWCSIKSLFQGQVLVNAFQKTPIRMKAGE